MIRYLFILCSLFALTSSQLPAQTLQVDSLYAPSLGRVKKCEIFLPAGYTRDHRYPLLILLHGFTGNYTNWWECADLKAYANPLPLIIVTADGENSWYVNHLTAPSEKFEEYITADLLGFVESAFSIDTSRVGIGGLSMGGYGALMLAMRHPGTFSFVAGLSASLDVPGGIPDLEKNNRTALKPSLLAAFGAERSQQWDNYDLFLLLRKITPENAPYFYLANGIQDEFGPRLMLYRAFSDSLRSRAIPYEYHETPGRHNCEYWNKQIKLVLDLLRRRWNLVSE